MRGVCEYAEELPVKLGYWPTSHGAGRWVVEAKNQAGYDGTAVDLQQLLAWVATNMPELYTKYLMPAQRDTQGVCSKTRNC